MLNIVSTLKRSFKNWLSVTPQWPTWSYADHFGLGRYAQPRAIELVNLDRDRWKNEENWRERVKVLFDALSTRDIAYEEAPSDVDGDRRQRIRHPYDILQRSRIANCLDLSVLFGGLCQAGRRQAILVVLNDHAFVAVCTKPGFLRPQDRQAVLDRKGSASTANAVWTHFGPGTDPVGNRRPYDPVTTDPNFLGALEKAVEEPVAYPLFKGQPPSKTQSFNATQPRSSPEPTFCVVEVTEATSRGEHTFDSAQRKSLALLRGALSDPARFRFALDIAYYPELSFHPFGNPSLAAQLVKRSVAILLLALVPLLLLYLSYRAYVYWPEEWMPRTSFLTNPILCDVQFARNAFPAPTGFGVGPEEQAKSMMNAWKFWTWQGMRRVDYEEYLIVKPRMSFEHWYYPLQLELTVFYDHVSKGDKTPTRVEARIAAAAAFLERTTIYEDSPRVRYRQQIVVEDFAREAVPWMPATISLQPPDKGESLTLLLRIAAHPINENDKRQIPAAQYYPLPASADQFHVTLCVKKEVNR